MSTYPAIVPSSRAFTPPTYPVTAHAATDGSERRIRHGNMLVDADLVLDYQDITEAEWLQIRAHYLAHAPLRRSFALPAEVLEGESADQFDETGYSWVYAAPPEVEDIQPDIHGVRVTLERIPEPAESGVTVRGQAAAFATVGRQARLAYTRRMTAIPAAFTTTGQVASLVHNTDKLISGQAAAFTMTGRPGLLAHDKVITGQAAAFTTTGQAASLVHNTDKLISGQAAAFTTAGEPALLLHNKAIAGQAAAFTTTGQEASLLISTDKVINGQAAAFSTTGEPALLLHNKVITGQAAAFTMTGQTAQLTKRPPGDPTFSNNSLLLPFDGDLVDYSPQAFTVTAIASATTNSGSAQFATQSLQLDGSTQCLTVPHNSVFDFGDEAWTIEGWCYIENSGVNTIVAKHNAWQLYLSGTTGGLEFSYLYDIGFTAFFEGGVNISGFGDTFTWQHVMVCCEAGGAMHIGANGTRHATHTRLGTLKPSTNPVNIGRRGGFNNDRFWSGRFNHLRIKKGVALYTGSTYTVPTAAFPTY